MPEDRKDAGAWFAPKRYGYGAGLPIRWQGWALMLGYTVLVTGSGLALMPRKPILFAGIVIAATAAVVVLSAQHTRGGWRWRWGRDKDGDA